jgi:hypothetical protein
VPTSGHEAGGAIRGNDGTPAPGMGLLDLGELSLEDLSRLDDSVVANILRDLVRRRRCGTESGERYNLFSSSI